MAQRWSQLERVAPLTGIAFVILAVIGGLLAFTGPDYLAVSEEIAAHYEENDVQVQVGGALILWAVPFLLWFMGSLYRYLRGSEADRGRLSVIAFGAGATAAAVLLLAGTTAVTVGARAGEPGTIGGDFAAAFFDIGSNLFASAAPVAFAVTAAATALLVFRARVFSAWFGWVSAVVALALLALPISWAAFPAFFVWVLLVSVWLVVLPRAPSA